MQPHCGSFDEFWNAFTCQQQPFRLARAGLSLARLAAKQPSNVRWRWAVAAAVVTAGKLLAGTFGDEIGQPKTDDAKSLPAGKPPAPRREARVDVAWAAWM